MTKPLDEVEINNQYDVVNLFKCDSNIYKQIYEQFKPRLIKLNQNVIVIHTFVAWKREHYDIKLIILFHTLLER